MLQGCTLFLHIDEENRVTDYAWYDDQRPNEILKGMPKYKLVL